jgi:hypothetical protein
MEKFTTLKGVQYLVDASGKRTAVVISLEEWGEIWEDFYDVLVSESRKGEPTVDWEILKAELANAESTCNTMDSGMYFTIMDIEKEIENIRNLSTSNQN